MLCQCRQCSCSRCRLASQAHSPRCTSCLLPPLCNAKRFAWPMVHERAHAVLVRIERSLPRAVSPAHAGWSGEAGPCASAVRSIADRCRADCFACNKLAAGAPFAPAHKLLHMCVLCVYRWQLRAGSLHVGGARTAIFNWLLARKTGGTVRLQYKMALRFRLVQKQPTLNARNWCCGDAAVYRAR